MKCSQFTATKLQMHENNVTPLKIKKSSKNANLSQSTYNPNPNSNVT